MPLRKPSQKNKPNRAVYFGEAPKPLRQNNLAISTASRHKGSQQNTLNCTGYFGAAPNRLAFLIRALGQECFRQAFQSIRTQRLRSALTLLGIVIGVAPVIALIGIMTGFSRTVSGAFARFGTSVVQFQKYDYSGGARDDTDQMKRRDLMIGDAEALTRSVTLAKAISPEVSHVIDPRNGNVKNLQGEEANNPVIQGVWPSFQIVRDMPLEEGRFFNEADLNHRSRAAIIGTAVRDALFNGRDPLGQTITLAGSSFTVVGLLVSRGNMLSENADDVVLIPFSTFAERFPERFTDNSGILRIALAPRNPEQQQAMIDQALAVLRVRRSLRGSQPNDFHYTTAESEMAQFKKISNRIAGGVLLVAGMALLVGGVGIMNIMLVSVTERTREIGTRKAFGATRRDIAAQFLVEAVALTALGGALGVALGLLMAMLIKAATPVPAEAPLWSIFLGLGVSSAIGLIFGIWPAVKASRLDPIIALRYE